MEDGGPAFPQADYGYRGNGMSLRDWFAGQALIGILASPRTPVGAKDMVTWEQFSVSSFEIADAMLKARQP